MHPGRWPGPLCSLPFQVIGLSGELPGGQHLMVCEACSQPSSWGLLWGPEVHPMAWQGWDIDFTPDLHAQDCPK